MIGEESPWGVTANVADSLGYIDKVCVQCSNGH